MRILIFGASGFIGTHLVRYAASQGHEVVALCRSGEVSGFAGECFKWGFGTGLAPEVLEDVGCAIHLAHDFNGPEGAELTLKETLSNVKQLRAAAVDRQIFFSSYSAGEHATSLYGRTKWAIEKDVAMASDVIIVRPGLVIGDGGIYARIRKWARKLPVILLPDGGHGQVPVITVERLCEETMAIAESALAAREYNLFESEQCSLRQLVLEAAEGKKPLIVSVPAAAIVFGLKIAAVLKLPLPVNADNLEGFIANQGAKHVSKLED